MPPAPPLAPPPFLPESTRAQLRQVAEAVLQGRAILFCGAGLSFNARPKNGGDRSLPGWGALVQKLADDLSEAARAGAPHRALQVADLYVARYGRSALIQRVRATIPYAEFDPGEIHRLIPQIGFREIITTNFDDLIERGFRQSAISVRAVTSGEELARHGAPRVIKPNGCFETAPGDIVLTGEDFRQFEATRPLMVSFLLNCFVECTVIFVGFSLADPAFDKIFGMVHDKLGSKMRTHYAIHGVIGDEDEEHWRAVRGLQILQLARPGDLPYGANGWTERYTQTFRWLDALVRAGMQPASVWRPALTAPRPHAASARSPAEAVWTAVRTLGVQASGTRAYGAAESGAGGWLPSPGELADASARGLLLQTAVDLLDRLVYCTSEPGLAYEEVLGDRGLLEAIVGVALALASWRPDPGFPDADATLAARADFVVLRAAMLGAILGCEALGSDAPDDGGGRAGGGDAAIAAILGRFSATDLAGCPHGRPAGHAFWLLHLGPLSALVEWAGGARTGWDPDVAYRVRRCVLGGGGVREADLLAALDWLRGRTLPAADHVPALDGAFTELLLRYHHLYEDERSRGPAEARSALDTPFHLKTRGRVVELVDRLGGPTRGRPLERARERLCRLVLLAEGGKALSVGDQPLLEAVWADVDRDPGALTPHGAALLVILSCAADGPRFLDRRRAPLRRLLLRRGLSVRLLVEIFRQRVGEGTFDLPVVRSAEPTGLIRQLIAQAQVVRLLLEELPWDATAAEDAGLLDALTAVVRAMLRTCCAEPEVRRPLVYAVQVLSRLAPPKRAHELVQEWFRMCVEGRIPGCLGLDQVDWRRLVGGGATPFVTPGLLVSLFAHGEALGSIGERFRHETFALALALVQANAGRRDGEDVRAAREHLLKQVLGGNGAATVGWFRHAGPAWRAGVGHQTKTDVYAAVRRRLLANLGRDADAREWRLTLDHYLPSLEAFATVPRGAGAPPLDAEVVQALLTHLNEAAEEAGAARPDPAPDVDAWTRGRRDAVAAFLPALVEAKKAFPTVEDWRARCGDLLVDLVERGAFGGGGIGRVAHLLGDHQLRLLERNGWKWMAASGLSRVRIADLFTCVDLARAVGVTLPLLEERILLALQDEDPLVAVRVARWIGARWDDPGFVGRHRWRLAAMAAALRDGMGSYREIRELTERVG